MKNYYIRYKNITEKQLFNILLFIPLLFILVSIIDMVVNKSFLITYYSLLNILLSDTILITDFFKVGNIASSYINASLVGLFWLYQLKRYKININGIFIAAFFTTVGFSFFGQNLFNIMPIFLGAILYAKVKKLSTRDIVIITMFGSGLAPVVSEISSLPEINLYFAPALAVLVGVVIGFVLPIIASHALRFHEGYNLYNIGFTAGIIGTVITSFLRTFDLDVTAVNIIYQKYDGHIKVLMLSLFLYLIVVGLYINKKSIKEYRDFFDYSGRTVTDFTFLIGYGKAFFNMGLLGFVFTVLVIVFKGTFNGPVIAGLLTVVGFGAFGKHLKNCYPPVLGVIVMAVILKLDLSSTGVLLAMLFSTTIAPIAGKFGPVVGVISGVLHLVLVLNIGVVHGGINLYHNGFSGGIVAGFLVPIIDAFKREKK